MDDLISRRRAIDELWEALYEYEDKMKKQFIESDELDVEDWIQHRNFVQNMNDIDRQTILNLPPAQPERKKGKWKRRIVDSGYNADWICSECGYRVKTDFVNYNFCPNCGADMRGEQDG